MMIYFACQSVEGNSVEHRSIRSWILAEGNKNTIDYGAAGVKCAKSVECIEDFRADVV